ncbi:hypothetical protein SLEP1_g2335 [Rubroshorea leprosula]|uniref:Uncharacterized protein n=1 Tax=Rubroshorea leprosula TaxID=152421 RepID=A0AAV5HP24_9ROSI|nr:hypothetical protein SLEP1_g2335 [Rubroshorea leprosula]
MQEILSLGQERNPANCTINGDGSVKRYEGMYDAPPYIVI